MPFKFRLEKILMLRRDALDQARLRVVDAQKALKEAIQRVTKITGDIRFANEEMIRNNYNLAQDRLREIRVLNEKLEKAKRERIQKEHDLIKAKEEMMEAHKRMEALEKLKAKQSEEFYLEENRIEQIQTDEKASLKFATAMVQKANNAEYEASEYDEELESIY